MKRAAIAILLTFSLLQGPALGYPLDLSEETGITRLAAYWRVLEGGGTLKTVPPGAQHPSSEIRLRLRSQPNFEIPPKDAALSAEIKRLLGSDAAGYGVSVLDLSDPANPRYGAYNGSKIQNPGSVGKIMVLLGWFQALADTYPDVEERKRFMRETQVTADEFVIKDSHKVPFWKPGDPKLIWRPLEIGDTANLWTFFDWMASASSNAAASMLISQLVLFKHFGKAYPVSASEKEAFFANTPKAELTGILRDAIQRPVTRNGLDIKTLRQGSFFTRRGKSRVPGTNSVATSRELVKYMVLMEQGKLIDPWSSLEIKRLLYLTDKRVRYASTPVLDDSAVYYKSGSLYSCKPEEGFTCGKYMGNRLNYLNSVAVIESRGPELHYIVAVLSNVLKKDSAEAHARLAEDLHALLRSSQTGSGGPTASAQP